MIEMIFDDPEEERDRMLQLMLATRYDLSQAVTKLSRHEALMVQQHIAEIDGYLVLQAPTKVRH